MSTKPRAPRKKAAAVVESPAEPVENAIVTAPAPAVEPTKAKKGKKPVKVVAVVTPDGIEGSFLAEPRRPLIAHLRIKTSEIEFLHDGEPKYNPNPPTDINVMPYDAEADDMFNSGHSLLETAASPAAVKEVASTAAGTAVEPVTPPAAPQPTTTSGLPCFYKADLMVQYKDSQEAKKLPLTTDIACFWCAHGFTGAPCIIPEREVYGTYNVYGNFCCPECAMSYLLTESLDPHVRWERMALLQRIYDTEGTGRIFPAPARESLSLFGGPMSIEVFRATVRGGKVRVDIHMPPMVSILGHIDTKPIDFFNTNLKNGPVTMPLDKVSKAEEGLRLKRTKPLKDKESTLDTVMNIQIAKRS